MFNVTVILFSIIIKLFERIKKHRLLNVITIAFVFFACLPFTRYFQGIGDI